VVFKAIGVPLTSRRLPIASAGVVKVYTRKGDDGTTGLLFGGRLSKSAPSIEANGAVDEAQAALGVVRAEAERGSELDDLLVHIERDLWVLMAEVATAAPNRGRLVPGTTLVTADMVSALEGHIDDLSERFEMPTEFVVPGQDRVSALLDVARTVVRRAERRAIGVLPDDSHVVEYLNRLSDLVWTMARGSEGEHLLARGAPRRTSRGTGPKTREETQ
jgi:cob(I)alamin adenosyltransferase